MKKAISLLLCTLFLAISLAACSSDTTETSSKPANSDSVSNSSQSKTESETSADIDYLKKIYSGDKYKGKTFTILTSGVNPTAVSEIVFNTEFPKGEELPTVLNEAIAERNSKVEELLGVKIAEIYFPDSRRHGGETLNTIRNSITTDDRSFQAISACLYDCGTLSMENILYDVNKLKNIDMENPWWDQGFTNTVTLGQKQYFFLGDIGINYKNSTPCVYYNKSLITRVGVQDPYLLAKDGKWTIDKAIELSTSYNEDIDGVEGIGYKDKYGWAGQYDDMPSMIYGAGVKILSPDSEGWPSLTLYSDKSDQAVEKVLKLMLNTDYYISGNDLFGKTDTQWPMDALQNAFIDGRVMFFSGGISSAIKFGKMEDTFGILPVPKLTDDQDEYYSLLNTWTTNGYAIALNNSLDDAEFAAAALEAMGYYSWSGLGLNTLSSLYYEKVLKNQKLTLEESSTMLDLIFKQRGCDLGSVFNIGKVSGQKTVNDLFGELISNKQSGVFRSSYDEIADSLKTDTDALIEYFKKG